MIEAVVFDVGRVLVDFDHGIFCRALTNRYGAVIGDELEFLAGHGFRDHEEGRLAGEEFLCRIGGTFSPVVHGETLYPLWVEIFEPLEEMAAIFESILPRYKTYLLSNAGELHWRYVEKAFAMIRKAHGAVVSFEAGVMKPDPRIYQLAEERFGLAPGRTVFIDDKRENVDAARGRGWHGIHHVSPATTRSELARLGVV